MRTKDKKYYHSEIEVEDVKFIPVIVDNIKYYKELVNKFNNTTDIELKRKYAENLPQELFGTCRICGRKIINTNSFIIFRQHSGEMSPYIPAIQYRIINGTKYEISACGECIEKHFAENKPKAPKYYYMRANKYGAFAYGYSYDEYKKICSSTTGVTEKSMIKKWGDEEGKRRWKEYCSQQALTNTFEYKQDVYGWDRKKFNEFNKSRAVTKKLCIERHGEEEGLKLWENYCDRQRYTTTLEYFIEEYGEENGKKKYDDFYKGRLFKGFGYSKSSQECFDKILNIIKSKYSNINYNEIKYASYNGEYTIYNKANKFLAKLDYYDKTNNIIIEFNGSLWHADPKFYQLDSLVYSNVFSSCIGITAQQIWENDKIRLDNIMQEIPGAKIFVIWESDWRENPDKAIEPIIAEYDKILK